jgi:hypothetical protein
MNPMPNKKSATRLSANILNYFAAFTETRFNFRTLINYRWTDNELTLDLGIFQEFQDELLQRIKTGDSTPITVKNNEHVLSLSGDDVLLEINKALSDKFGLEYHTKNPDIVTKHNFSQEYLDYDISRQIEIESYGYRFLRLNKFNLRPEQDGETKTDVLDKFLRKAFAVE